MELFATVRDTCKCSVAEKTDKICPVAITTNTSLEKLHTNVASSSSLPEECLNDCKLVCKVDDVSVGVINEVAPAKVQRDLPVSSSKGSGSADNSVCIAASHKGDSRDGFSGTSGTCMLHHSNEHSTDLKHNGINCADDGTQIVS